MCKRGSGTLVARLHSRDIENVTGGRAEVGPTPIRTLGPPRLVRLGVRLRL